MAQQVTAVRWWSAPITAMTVLAGRLPGGALTFMLSPGGQVILARHGFTAPTRPVR